LHISSALFLVVQVAFIHRPHIRHYENKQTANQHVLRNGATHKQEAKNSGNSDKTKGTESICPENTHPHRLKIVHKGTHRSGLLTRLLCKLSLELGALHVAEERNESIRFKCQKQYRPGQCAGCDVELFLL